MSDQTSPETRSDSAIAMETAPVPRSPWALRIFRYRFVFLLVVGVVVVGLDQSSKIWARDTLARPMPKDSRGVVHYRPVREIHVIRGVFHFQYAENPAAAFSLTRSIPVEWRRPLLLVVSSLAMVLLLFWLARLREPDVILILGFSLVLAGALGNFIDRNLYHYVIDFVSWRLTRWWPGLPPWPTFNIADTSIVGGAMGIIFRSFFPFERQIKAPGAKATAETEAA